jgi:hypothetical protein
MGEHAAALLGGITILMEDLREQELDHRLRNARTDVITVYGVV